MFIPPPSYPIMNSGMASRLNLNYENTWAKRVGVDLKRCFEIDELFWHTWREYFLGNAY